MFRLLLSGIYYPSKPIPELFLIIYNPITETVSPNCLVNEKRLGTL